MNTATTSKSDLFRTLYGANHDRVHRLLGRIVGPQEAEDLTQIVFAKAAKLCRSFAATHRPQRGFTGLRLTSLPIGFVAARRARRS